MISRSRLYDGRLTAEDVRALYGRWGGRPRYVLEKARDVVHQRQLGNKIFRCDPMGVVKSWADGHRGEEADSDG